MEKHWVLTVEKLVSKVSFPPPIWRFWPRCLKTSAQSLGERDLGMQEPARNARVRGV